VSAAAGIAKRAKAREAQAKRRAVAAGRAAAQSLREACRCVDRADRALRRVETSDDEDRCTVVEHAAATVKAAHGRCEVSARAAGSAGRKGDARGAVRAAGVCERVLREAQVAVRLAEKHAR
jgi:hypothetical protein